MLANLNLNHLRVFEAVYRTRNMTRAAEELHLTQSGVSQHMKSLEDSLGFRLFDRVKRKLLPTERAEILFKQCNRAIQALESVFEEVSGKSRSLGGTVTLGMPVEFGNNILLPHLAKFQAQHPGTEFAFRTGLARELEPLLLEGAIDFAFVDAFRLDPAIETLPVFEEDIHLCIGAPLIRSLGKPEAGVEYLKKLPWVDYEAGGQVLRMWFRHHFGGSHKFDTRLRAWGLDAQGVARMIALGVGAGVLPGHVVESAQKKGFKIQVIPTRSEALINRISLAKLKERTLSSQSAALHQWLVQSFKKGI